MSFSKSLKQTANKIWAQSYQHPFVQELGQGTLPRETFQFYLLQDYLYLQQYAKVFALGAIKSSSEKLISQFTEAQYSIMYIEMDLHRQYMLQFGINRKEVNQVKPSVFNQAYTSYMLSVGQTGDLAELLAAVFPCAWSYYDFACQLKKDFPEQLVSNPYQSWIEMYAGEAFFQSFEWFFAELDVLCHHKNKEEQKRVENIFIRSMEFEYLFWEMAYNRSMLC